MPTFPESKNDILILAAKAAAGIQNNPGNYPNPPFDAALLSQYVGEDISIIERRQEKEAELKVLVDEDNAKVAQISALLRMYIDEAVARYPKDAGKLKEIGWDVQAERKYHEPGQVRNFEVAEQGPGVVLLDWKAPARTKSVGTVRGYRIERQIHDIETRNITEEWGQWERTAYETEETLHDQPRGVEISYRIVATNNNGDGPASDVETVVL